MAVLVLFCLVAGCAGPRPKEIINNPTWVIEKSYVVQPEVLKQGGNLLVVPFYPGPDVPATEEIRALSLKIVQGISDTLNEHDVPLTVLSASNADDAQLTMRGSIHKYGKPQGLKKWIPGQKQLTIAARGKIADSQTGDVLLYFVEEQSGSFAEEEDRRQIAYTLGKNIALYIIRQLETAP